MRYRRGMRRDVGVYPSLTSSFGCGNLYHLVRRHADPEARIVHASWTVDIERVLSAFGDSNHSP
jgi:hypothetical protein